MRACSAWCEPPDRPPTDAAAGMLAMRLRHGAAAAAAAAVASSSLVFAGPRHARAAAPPDYSPEQVRRVRSQLSF